MRSSDSRDAPDAEMQAFLSLIEEVSGRGKEEQDPKQVKTSASLHQVFLGVPRPSTRNTISAREVIEMFLPFSPPAQLDSICL
jgi:hypothetical protein